MSATRWTTGSLEGVVGLYMTECIRATIFDDGPGGTIADVEYATPGYVDWYDQRRFLSTDPWEWSHP